MPGASGFVGLGFGDVTPHRGGFRIHCGSFSNIRRESLTQNALIVRKFRKGAENLQRPKIEFLKTVPIQSLMKTP